MHLHHLVPALPGLGLLTLLPSILANPIPQDTPTATAPLTALATSAGLTGSTVVRSAASVAGSIAVVTSARSAAASGSAVGSVPSGATRSSAARPTGPYGEIPFGVRYDDPEEGARIHPLGRSDLCVVVINETVTEGAVVEIGRCLNNTLPYPGKRNIFNLTTPFPLVAVNTTSNSTNITTSVSTTSLSTRPVPSYVTLPARQADVEPSSGSAFSSAIASARSAASGASGGGVRSATSPRPASSRAPGSTSTSTAPRPTETRVYEGLIAPLGQEEYCLSGDIFDPYDEDDVESSAVSSVSPSQSRPVARQLETSGIATRTASGIVVSSMIRPSSSRPPVGSSAVARPSSSGTSSTGGRARRATDGLITLQRCNASDPAQWWRLGADVRVNVPGIQPGQGWKLSLANQTQCASILSDGSQRSQARRVFKMYPCVRNSQFQLLSIANNSTESTATNLTTTSVGSSVSLTAPISAS